ncbi:hypothetical protein [Rubritalea sp.]|uniref:hypothetical protein n=1 Tax=Rubritalea sp. TaxID=2109375 RepID=UPI003EFB194A
MKTTLSDSKLLLTNAADAPPGVLKRKGSFLVEASVSLFILVSIAIVLVNASFNILQPRSWVMKQNLADAYLSQEVAAANNVAFANIEAGTSAWGGGALSAPAVQALGLLPGFSLGTGNGRAYNGQIMRQRTTLQGTQLAAGLLFRPTNSGGALTTAQMGIRAYQLESHVSYVINGKTFIKSRTVVRSE